MKTNIINPYFINDNNLHIQQGHDRNNEVFHLIIHSNYKFICEINRKTLTRHQYQITFGLNRQSLYTGENNKFGEILELKTKNPIYAN
jgi:hypothetical protein